MKSEDTGDVFDASHTIFSQNHKISPRQIRRALTMELFGAGSLLLPPCLAGTSGILGVAALCIGAAGAWVLVHIWDCLSERCDFEGVEQNGHGTVNRIIQRILLVMSGAGLLVLAGYVLYLLTVLLRDQLLTARYEAAILLTLTAAGVFGLRKGLESRIRVYEVLFWFLIVPLVIMLILACFSVHPRYWTITSYSVQGFGKSCWVSFLFFSISSLILFFKPHCSVPKRAVKSAGCSIFLVLVLYVAVYLILIGVFQDSLLSRLQFPVILLMAVVKLPGNFFERQDAFMVGIWFFCLFALFHSLLFYGSKALQNGFCRKKPDRSGLNDQKLPDENSGERMQKPAGALLPGVICGTIVFLGALWLLCHEQPVGSYLVMLLCLTGSLLLVLPFVYYVFARK